MIKFLGILWCTFMHFPWHREDRMEGHGYCIKCKRCNREWWEIG